jgi:hypothetical protein
MPNTYTCLRRQCISRENKKICTIQPEDIQPIRVWRNAQLPYLRQSHPIEFDEQVKYYRDNIWPTMELERPSNILMSYFEEAQLIGYGGLVHISWEHKRAEVSFLLDPDRMLTESVFLSDLIFFLS